jgi:TRAP-type C4-dicarboxylate transport system permease small subunit
MSPDTIANALPSEHVLDEEGHFHATDAPIDLSQYPFEAWLSFVLFWLLALDVFYQFFTRYALNSSAAWTEEIARYLLIGTVFIAMSAAVREERHIHVDFLYRFLGPKSGRVLATIVDVIRIVFFAAACVLTWQLMDKMGNYRMTIIDLPMNIVYGVCMFGFFCAFVRSIGVMIRHLRQGYSILERPETLIEETVS